MAVFASCCALFGATGPKVPLWPEGKMPSVQENQPEKPFLVWHEPEKKTCDAVMISVSGGAYMCNCIDGCEVSPIRDFLLAKGMTVVTMKYRTPRPKGLAKHVTAWQDAQRTVRIVRSEAKARGLDPQKIGFTGCSAGGHLALMAAVSSMTPAYEPVDDIDSLPCNVNFAVPVYPAYVLADGVERPNVRGGNDLSDGLATELAFDAATPPMCFFHGDSDEYSAMGSVRAYHKLRTLGIPAELHAMALEQHCFQRNPRPGTPAATWKDRVWEWLVSLDFVSGHAAGSATPSSSSAPLRLEMGFNGDVMIGAGGLQMRATIYHEGWAGSSSGVRPDFRFPDAKTCSTTMEFFRDKKLVGTGTATLLQTSDGRAAYSVAVTSQVDQNPEGVALALTMPCEAYCGGTWIVDGKMKGCFPEKFNGKGRLYSGRATSLALKLPSGQEFEMAFPGTANLLIQDDRRWGPTVTLRISFAAAHAFRKGDQRAFACIFSAPSGVEAAIAKPVVISRGEDWIPLDYRKDIAEGSALDFSGMGLQDAPAGKYGWLKNVGGHFEFEGRPGVRQRFYGVNLCFDSCFPDKEMADRLVTRFVRLGYNALRIHHYERSLVRGSNDRLALNPEQADRLDYLLARAYEKGIYVTTDIYVSRPVMWRDIGFDKEGVAPFKSLIGVHEPAFENWKAFARNLMEHVNPYTGRRYADEPGLPLISLVNEGHLKWSWDKIRHLEPMKVAWRKWLAGRRAADPSFCKDASDDSSSVTGWDRGNPALMCFMADVEADVARRERAFLSSLGVKALLTSQNCGEHYTPMMTMREACYDYVDDHFYVDHPYFIAQPWSLPSKCPNKNPVLSTRLPPVRVAYTRMPSKPFCITEWNFSGPGMFRGVGGIMTGALGALQEWDGLWRFAYSHDPGNLFDGKGSPGYFDMASDPLSQASDRASICLFLRGDMPPLADRLALAVPEDGRATGIVPHWLAAAWQTQVGTAAAPVPTGVKSIDLHENLNKDEPPVPLAPNRSLAFDRTVGSFRIDTPRTVGGFTPKGSLEAGPVAFDVGDVPATLWASSLDGQPIAHSARLLVSHLTDVQAEGNVYMDTAKTTLLKWGTSQPVVRNGSASVSLALERPEAYEVWGLETTGRRLERLPAKVVGGRLSFTAAVKGAHGARMLYEVAKKGR